MKTGASAVNTIPLAGVRKGVTRGDNKNGRGRDEEDFWLVLGKEVRENRHACRLLAESIRALAAEVERDSVYYKRLTAIADRFSSED
jgi:transposase